MVGREIKVAQRSDEWYALRAGRITASAVSNVLAKIKTGEASDRKNYRAQLVVERLTGKPVENGFMTHHMQRGIEIEPFARAAYEVETGNVVTESGFWVFDDLLVGASPDGLVGDEGLLEIKCPSLPTHLGYLLGKKLPSIYEPQVQTQLWVTGRKWCDFMSYSPDFPDSLQRFIVRVDRNEPRIQEIETETRKFLSEVETELDKLLVIT